MTAATQPGRREEFLQLVGDPRRVAREIQRAQRSGAVLSGSGPRLMDEYEGQWIALDDGEVIASGESLDAVLAQLSGRQRSSVLVRHIERNDQVLIL